MLAISIDDDDSRDLVRPFFRQSGGTFPVVRDADHRISNLFRVSCSPTFYVVDQTGVACHTGKRRCFFRRAGEAGLEEVPMGAVDPEALYGKAGA